PVGDAGDAAALMLRQCTSSRLALHAGSPARSQLNHHANNLRVTGVVGGDALLLASLALYLFFSSRRQHTRCYRDWSSDVCSSDLVDEATGLMGTVIIEHKEDLHPQIVIMGDKKEVLASYSIPAGAHVIVEEGQKVRAGALLAKTPRKVAKTKDITGGLPRVAELFEARRPKDAAEIAKIDGIVEFGGTVRGKRSLVLKDPDTGAEEEHLISLTKHIIVFKGDFVKKGQQLTEGPIVPHEILEVCGPQELQEHLVNEVQEVYRLQGVEINDKHIEIIVRQMLRKVKIT